MLQKIFQIFVSYKNINEWIFYFRFKNDTYSFSKNKRNENKYKKWNKKLMIVMSYVKLKTVFDDN